MPETTPETPDIMTLVCTRPALEQTITVTIPPDVVAILQALSDNVTVPDPDHPGQTKKKYLYAANVIWSDVLALLVPYWLQTFVAVSTAPLQAQIQATQVAAQQQFQQGVDAITVVGP